MGTRPTITLTPAENANLKGFSASRSVSRKLRERAQIGLPAAEGLLNREIARSTGHDEPKVSRWRKRCADQELDGIIKDKTRPGRIKPISSAKTSRMVKLAVESKPKGSTDWSRTTTARELGVTPSSLGRVWATHGLKPQRIRTFKLSNDQIFGEKLENIVGLCLSPPEHAKVKAWQKRNPRFPIHFTPTSASWLNMVERFFRDLTDKAIRRGVFHKFPDLVATIEDCIQTHNTNPRPFIWTASATDILEKVKRCRKTLDNIQSA